MRITKEQLKQIIKEELEAVMDEGKYGTNYNQFPTSGKIGEMGWEAKVQAHNDKESFLLVKRLGGQTKKFGPWYAHQIADTLGQLNDKTDAAVKLLQSLG